MSRPWLLNIQKRLVYNFILVPKHEIYTFFITRILNYFKISIKIGNGIYSNSLKTMDFFFRFSFFFKFIRFTVSLKIINFIFYKRCEIYFLLAIFSMFMPHSAHGAYRIIKVFMNWNVHIKNIFHCLFLFSCALIEYLYNMLI